MEYYVILQSEGHRDAWTSVLILIFTRLLKLNDERVRKSMNCLFIRSDDFSSNISPRKSIRLYPKLLSSISKLNYALFYENFSFGLVMYFMWTVIQQMQSIQLVKTLESNLLIIPYSSQIHSVLVHVSLCEISMLLLWLLLLLLVFSSPLNTVIHYYYFLLLLLFVLSGFSTYFKLPFVL